MRDTQRLNSVKQRDQMLWGVLLLLKKGIHEFYIGSTKEHYVKKQGTCNAKTELGSRNLLHSPLSELKIQNNDRDGGIEDSFRDRSLVFDPDLLAFLESKLKSTRHNGQHEDDSAENRGENREEGLQNGMANFEYRCPRGGSGRVVLSL
eukprot:TRINITY_DN10632_c0_g4_i2.p1 TRINITY_DN10632_c0_g4~~TRINITY_DN10632_c0_g4_i2.p1  ORF type:complete len:149 (+),score=26.96 TRINITY_DN10632_c0_g4_i2:350-796(+)